MPTTVQNNFRVRKTFTKIQKIIDIPNIYQNLIKSIILLAAIIIDSLVNPRDEQTAQQGDI